MTLTRALARPLLSSMFVFGGLDAVRHPETKVKTAEPVAGPIAERVPGLTTDTETLVRVNGAVMVAGGTLLALGKFRRVAAAALIASLLPTTYAGHRFWEETDEATRAQQRIHFLKNLGLLGGLILAAMDTEGRPSLAWRAKGGARGARRLGSGSARAVRVAQVARVVTGRRAGKHAAAKVEDQLVKLSRSTGRSARRVARAAGDRASSQARDAASQARGAVSHGRDAASQALGVAEPVVASGVHRAGQVWADVAEHLPVP